MCGLSMGKEGYAIFWAVPLVFYFIISTAFSLFMILINEHFDFAHFVFHTTIIHSTIFSSNFHSYLNYSLNNSNLIFQKLNCNYNRLLGIVACFSSFQTMSCYF